MKTSTDGFPDRFYAKNGRVVLIEFKRDGKEPTPIQYQRIKELQNAGVEAYVVDNETDAKRILR